MILTLDWPRYFFLNLGDNTLFNKVIAISSNESGDDGAMLIKKVLFYIFFTYFPGKLTQQQHWQLWICNPNAKREKTELERWSLMSNLQKMYKSKMSTKPVLKTSRFQIHFRNLFEKLNFHLFSLRYWCFQVW